MNGTTLNSAFLGTNVFNQRVPTLILDRLIRVFGNGAAQINGEKFCQLYAVFSNKNISERIGILAAVADIKVRFQNLVLRLSKDTTENNNYYF